MGVLVSDDCYAGFGDVSSPIDYPNAAHEARFQTWRESFARCSSLSLQLEAQLNDCMASRLESAVHRDNFFTKPSIELMSGEF